MSRELMILTGTAATIGLVHTIIGPDHYLPFVALSRARRWSLFKTLFITVLCGIGHVGSSVVLGAVGIAAGIALRRLELFESARGDIAAWLLTSFGVVYMVWGIVRAARNRSHTHPHGHADGREHDHPHAHDVDHAHPHEEGRASVTPWILFTIFVFGPCEPLIPLLMYPAAAASVSATALVASVFALATIGTMTAIVAVLTASARLVPGRGLERYSHALAGGAILACGVAILAGL